MATPSPTAAATAPQAPRPPQQLPQQPPQQALQQTQAPQTPPVLERTGPPCQECYRYNCQDPLMLLTRTECLHCDRCAPSAKFPSLFDPTDPKYARFQGCFPELKSSCVERQCLTTGDVTSGRCAGCERCPVVQGPPTCSRGLKEYGMKMCENMPDLVENDDQCHLCDACVSGGDEFRKLKTSPFILANRDKDCRISFGPVPGTTICEPLPWSAVTPPSPGGPNIEPPPVVPVTCRGQLRQKFTKCLPKSKSSQNSSGQPPQGQPPQGQPPQGQPAQGQPQVPVPDVQQPQAQCPATLVGTCRKAGNECLTTGDVAAKAWCKECGPCVVAGAVTCSANQRTFCTKNCTTEAAKTTKACVTSCATC